VSLEPAPRIIVADDEPVIASTLADPEHDFGYAPRNDLPYSNQLERLKAAGPSDIADFVQKQYSIYEISFSFLGPSPTQFRLRSPSNQLIRAKSLGSGRTGSLRANKILVPEQIVCLSTCRSNRVNASERGRAC
jgi:hypothetical protein